MSAALRRATATQLRAGYQSGAFTPLEVVDALLGAITEEDAALGAWLHIRTGEVRAEAERMQALALPQMWARQQERRSLRTSLRCASLISGPPFLFPCHAHSPCLRRTHFQGSTKKNMKPNMDTFRLL